MSTNKLSDFVSHMEFSGYEFEDSHDEPNTALGKHNRHGSTIVFNAGGPTTFRAYFNVGSNAIKKRLQFLELVNELNKKSGVSRFTGYDEYLFMVAIYIGPYDKNSFGDFMEIWHDDINVVFQQEDIDQFSK